MIGQTRIRLYTKALLKGAPALPASVKPWVTGAIAQALEDGYTRGQAIGEVHREALIAEAFAGGRAIAEVDREALVAEAFTRAKGKLAAVENKLVRAERQLATARKKLARAEARLITARKNVARSKEAGIKIGQQAAWAEFPERAEGMVKKMLIQQYNNGLQKGYEAKGVPQYRAGYKAGYDAGLKAAENSGATALNSPDALSPAGTPAISWLELPDLAKEAMLVIWDEFLEPTPGQVHVVRAGHGRSKWACVAGSGKDLLDAQVECLLNLDLLVHVGARGGAPKLSLTEHAINMLHENA